MKKHLSNAQQWTIPLAWWIAFCGLVFASPHAARCLEAEEFRPGLAGAQYDNEEFTEVDGDPNLLYGLDRHWAASRGNDWRAAWFGFIEAPYSGAVTISAVFEDGMELAIDGKTLIAGIDRKGRNKDSAVVEMTRGEKLPISLKFITYNSKALLQLSWQWEGVKKAIIPGQALSHKLRALPPDLRFEFEYAGLEHIGTWDIFAPVPPTPAPDEIDVSAATIVPLRDTAILRNAADMLADEIRRRTRLGIPIADEIAGNDSDVLIVIGTRDDLETHGLSLPAALSVPDKQDGYAIWTDRHSGAATIYLIGHDERGALFATGRLLRLLDMGRDWAHLNEPVQISTAPVTPLRGHQFAYRPKTNSYDGWTIAMWEQYYRDMIVFGTNAIELLPPRTDDALDSPHFPRPPLDMMVNMSQLAKDYGLDVWIWFPAMEDGYDDEQVLNAVLEEWAVVFRALPKVDVVFVPGGDPGNTHPSVLFAFMEKQKANLNKYHPNAQIWMSPQGFDWNGERESWLQDLYDLLKTDKPQWLGGVVFGPAVATSLPELREAIPEQYPIRRYPDITHSARCQYPVEDWDDAFEDTLDREPINPRPRFYAKLIRELQQYAIGFITYSEGCNDDVNKIVWSSLGWDPDLKVEDILKEYSKYFISLRYRDQFAEGLAGLEENWEGPLNDNRGVYPTLRLFQEMEEGATMQDRLNWRFQQGLYRAYYDAYIKAKLPWSEALEEEARTVLMNAEEIGSLAAIEQVERIIDRRFDDPEALEWRARVFELAEALYQSARMQLSVRRYGAIRQGRGATLDGLDAPLFDIKGMKREFMHIRGLDDEEARLKAITEMID